MQILAAAAVRAGTVLESPEGGLRAAAFRRRVAALSGHLAERGLGLGDRVVLAGPRGAETLIALYACWHGGFVAVPVEAGLPPARLRPIFAAADPAAAVAVGKRASILLRSSGDVPCFLSTDPQPGEGRLSDAWASSPRPAAELPADALGSLHFTSGSTGDPRGVPYTRAGIDVFAIHWVRAFGLTPEDRVVWAFPMAYAPSLIPLGSAVASGASILPLAAAAASVADLARGVLQQATVLLGVPSLVAALLDRGALAGSPLRTVAMAGEPVPASLALRLQDELPGLRVINFYGTTECNAISAYEVRGPVEGSHLPAGEPLPFMSVQIVDGQGAPCEEGEVVVAGPTVMQEYWGGVHRASWFELDGLRHYRTGDRGRRGVDGQLHLLGRADRQVKIGGHRVELGPVEAAMVDVPGVREAAVVSAGEGEARRLVGFLVGEASPDEVLQTLRTVLPAYARPERLVVLDALPRGPRGKVDLVSLRRRAEEGA